MDSISSTPRRRFLIACLAPLATTIAMPRAVDGFGQAAARAAKPAGGGRRGRQVGLATFYSRELTGDKTASGTRYDPSAMTAAHRNWPFGTVVRVTELESGRSVEVTITDRGPFGKNRRKGAVIDLSRAAARELNMVEDGVTRVRLDVVRWGSEAEAKKQQGQ